MLNTHKSSTGVGVALPPMTHTPDSHLSFFDRKEFLAFVEPEIWGKMNKHLSYLLCVRARNKPASPFQCLTLIPPSKILMSPWIGYIFLPLLYFCMAYCCLAQAALPVCSSAEYGHLDWVSLTFPSCLSSFCPGELKPCFRLYTWAGHGNTTREMSMPSTPQHSCPLHPCPSCLAWEGLKPPND